MTGIRIASKIIRRVDHIIVAVADPQPQYTFFTETLKLPSAWPVKDYGAFASGGVFLGNVNLEFLRMGSSVDQPKSGSASSKLSGIAFEPVPLTEAIAELTQRNIPHSGPQPIPGLWTNVYLNGLGAPSEMIFLCEYMMQVAPINAANQATLQSRKGGPLGLLGVAEIRVGFTDEVSAKRRWQTLLEPLRLDEQGTCKFAEGPALRLSKDQADGLRSIQLRVSSLETAKAFLSAQGMLAHSASSVVEFSTSALPGLHIQLTN